MLLYLTASFLHSVPRGGSRKLSPDAVTNVVHGYAHFNDKEEPEEVVPVSSSTKKRTFETKTNEWDEDPFFHAVLHNNDDNSSVMNNVGRKTSHERADEEMFVNFSKKLFHYPRNNEEEVKEEKEKVHEKSTYGLREFIKDSSLME